jgi:peroxiredoxin
MTVDVGDAAPDFELIDQHGKPVRLSERYRNGTVVLVFYPLAFSHICQGELCEIRDELARLGDSGTTVLVVSVDSMFAHQAWAAQQGYDFPLLADFWPHGEVARKYGVFDSDRGVAVRGTFVIDRLGTVRWKVVNSIGAPRSVSDYQAALADIA